MRNLITLNKGNIIVKSQYYPQLSPDEFTYDCLFDIVTNSLTCVLHLTNEGFVEIQQHLKTGEINLLANFPLTQHDSKLLSFSHFEDSFQLILIFDNGDIVQVTYDPVSHDADLSIVEIVGSIDMGLKAAKWSPDEETLSLITNENNLVLLSRSFDPIAEKILNPDDTKVSKDKHVSVGWGKAETQFRGKGVMALEREKSILQHAGLDLKDESSPLRDPTVVEPQQGTISLFENNETQISWRGDCEFFGVTTIEPVSVENEDGESEVLYHRRVIRVFNRLGELESVNEATDGLEHNLAWKPSGAVFASTSRYIDSDSNNVLDVLFYERNGLKRYNFNTRLDASEEIVYDIQWSSDSEILALHLLDRVQLWTTKNFHWYLKQELFVNSIDAHNKVIFVKFHPEKNHHLIIGTSRQGILIVDLGYKIVSGPTQLGNDVGMVLVTDGTEAKITPLGIANIPPPISFKELEVNGNINDMAVSKSNEIHSLLTSNGDVYIGFMKLGKKKTRGPKTKSVISHTDFVMPDQFPKQVAIMADSIMAVLVDGVDHSVIVCFDITNVEKPIVSRTLEFPLPIVLMKSSADFETLSVESITGEMLQIDQEFNITTICQFPHLCRDFEVVKTSDKVIAFGLTESGKLFANETQVNVGVTSIKVTESHLIFTTVQAKLCFVHLNSSLDHNQFVVFQNKEGEESALVDERIRSIERGSILVSAIPSTYQIVLEAQRGNLETICPRIMVLSGVRLFIRNKNYKRAFLACRVHRIDLDILHDYDPELFFNNLENFVQQIDKVDHLDLFVSGLHEEDVTQTKYRNTLTEVDGVEPTLPTLPAFNNLSINADNKKIIHNKERTIYNENSKVNKICQGILSVLMKPIYFDKYLQTILTGFACQKPPNLLEALKLVGQLKDSDKLEQSVIHLCFLSDVNKLYDAALSLYDVKLTLAIAQQSQKDPKEYLPFLQKLHEQKPKRKEFMIDDYLKNHIKALNWLHQLEDVKDEFDDYVIKHSLYKEALKIYRYDQNEFRTRDILNMFGQHLRNEKNFHEAGNTFEALGEFDEALDCYIQGKCWQEAMATVSKPEFVIKSKEIAENLVDALTVDHKYNDAAFIEVNFLGNLENAIKLYCKQYNYNMAILLAVKHQKPEFIKEIVDGQLSEGFGTIAELLADFKSQLNSQLNRLRELRTKKAQDPYSFYGIPSEELDIPDNVSVAASEYSATPSFFTRYTGKTAGTAKTGASRKTAKNRKREERKRAKGRKGTIYEEEYIINSVGRLIERMDQTQNDALSLIDNLIKRNMRTQAYQIQKNWIEVLDFLKSNVQEIYKMEDRDRERLDDNGEVYLIPEIPIPTLKEFPIRHTLDY